MTTGLSTSGTLLPYHPGGNGFAIASPRVAMFSPDDKYLVIANDITFDIFKVDKAGNYSEMGPETARNGMVVETLPSGT